MVEIIRIEIPIPFALRTVNCYYIPGSVPTLIDPGINTPEALAALRTKLAEHHTTPEKIRRIILTHVHSDHAGLTGKLVQMTGAQLFVHRWEEEKISFVEGGEVQRRNRELFLNFFAMADVPGEIATDLTSFLLSRFQKYLTPLRDLRFLDGGEIFSFDDMQLKVVHSPGHTAGSICLFNEAEGILVAGDSLLKRISPNPIAELQSPDGRAEYAGLRHYQASLRTLAGLSVNSVLPGHGAAFVGHRRRIERLLHHHRERRHKLLDILCAGMERSKGSPGMTLHTLARLLFPQSSSRDLFLTISEVLGHLQLLQDDGVVDMTAVGGRRFYRYIGECRAGGAMH